MVKSAREISEMLKLNDKYFSRTKMKVMHLGAKDFVAFAIMYCVNSFDSCDRKIKICFCGVSLIFIFLSNSIS